MIAFSELPDKDRANIIAKAVRNGAKSLEGVEENYQLSQNPWSVGNMVKGIYEGSSRH